MQVSPQTLIVGQGKDARDICYIADPPGRDDGLGLLWLSGFMSDMASTKATALAEWAKLRGIGITRFDYSGHGVSGGNFLDGTIGRWLKESVEVFRSLTRGPHIIIGSSMGGYIALLLLKHLVNDFPAEAARVKGLVLIAPAWDMTESLMWKNFTPEARGKLETEGVYYRPSQYGSPYPLTAGLITEGRNHLLEHAGFNPGRPVEIMQGLLDTDVPAAHTRRLLDILHGEHVTLTEISDGEHRLSRPEDLAILYKLITRVAES